MANDYGTGVSRTLTAIQRQFTNVVFQKSKPPLDSELNLQDDLHSENVRNMIRAQVPSGFLTDTVNTLEDYVTDPNWSNFFDLGRAASDEEAPTVMAVVDGLIVPVIGTAVDAVTNRVRLNPAPATDSRIDLVFLEVWRAQISPNPSTTNKPSASSIHAYGNVEFGGTNFSDDLEDPTIGFETTERVQIQYRFRVFGFGAGGGAGVALGAYPDGLDDPNCLGQGTSDSPQLGFTFQNQRLNGDAGLWRSGDGDPTNALGTVDGYVYAVPVCAVFRRNSTTFTAVSTSGNPNQNGGYDRNRSATLLADPRDGYKAFTTPTLTADLDASTTGDISVTGLVGSYLEDSEFISDLTASTRFLVLGSGSTREVVEISAVDNTGSPTTITISATGRGRADTDARNWASGTSIQIYTNRPDGQFADEVRSEDIHDLRRSVSFGEWDYQRLLNHNFNLLLSNRLRSSYKQNGAGGDTEGSYLTEVSYMWSDGAPSSVPNHTELVDGPDGVRTVFSDSAAVQPEVVSLLDPTVALTNGFTTTTFDEGVSWDVNPGFTPSGWLNDPSTPGWSNGSIIYLHIGGSSGTAGARGSFATVGTGEGAVRFLGPREYNKLYANDPVHPVTLQFNDQPATFTTSSEDTSSEVRPGPLYPRPEANFERPLIVLGGIIRDDLQVTTGISTDTSLTNLSPGLAEVEIGVDFDATAANLALNETRTLDDMITAGGSDRTGDSSEVYIILYGDEANPGNNGVWQVVAVGTAGTTHRSATTPTGVVVKAVMQNWASFATGTGQGLTAEFRSQHTSSADGSGLTSGKSAMAVVITDIENLDGGVGNPWNVANTGTLAIPSSVTSKAVISTAIQYGPGRGGFARVPSEINRIAMTTADSNFLRQPLNVRDGDFSVITGEPGSEVVFESNHVQLWNQLDGAEYRGARYAENARESEVFVDPGSRTVILRPFQNKSMTLTTLSAIGTGSLIGDPAYPAGSTSAGLIKDGASVHTANPAVDPITVAVPVPSEYMPSFGRQDIPYHIRTGAADVFLGGINHLFTDKTGDDTNSVFSIVGGPPGSGVRPMLFQSGSSSGAQYGGYSTITHPNHPAYQSRLIELPSEVSADTGKALHGIQLPPHMGIARLYGVYERQDYIDKVVAIGGASVTIPGAFLSDRVTPKASFPTNLLRTDASQGTLFILKDGAQDVTGETGDHTYVVPDAALDISRIPSFADGNMFSDFEYVVECVTFGFSRGFINENNYVLSRRLDGTGAAVVAGSELLPDMAIPAAAPAGGQFYSAYNRVVYQGDPYMTRDGDTLQVADFNTRYGLIPQSDAYEINFPIQQFDSAGDQIPEKVNPRALEVLASIDFWTTMGTGKIGGETHFGTEADAGWLMGGDRLPSTPTSPQFDVASRAFSAAPLPGEGVASAMIVIRSASDFDSDGSTFSNVNIIVTKPDGTQVTVSTSALPVGVTESAMASALTNVILSAPEFQDTLGVVSYDAVVQLFSRIPGELGNQIRVEFEFDDGTSGVGEALSFVNFFPGGGISSSTSVVSSLLRGAGADVRNAAGHGDSSVFYSGLTERLPLGILVNDFDFIHEAPVNNGVTTNTMSPAIRDTGANGPIAQGGFQYPEVDSSGNWILMSDGSTHRYAAYSDTNISGTKRFRTNRGGAIAHIEGAPVRWSAGGFSPDNQPVLKGAILTGRAMLVRNQHEEAFTVGSTGRKRSDGDEIQMIITTKAIYGSPRCLTEGLTLDGEISPTGYGDGYAAADRYRLEGKPMEKGRATNTQGTDNELVPYRTSSEPRIDDGCP